jgi:hypothetical protein
MIFVSQLNAFGYSPYVTPSLMRGWICHLQLLLVLVSAVILMSESHGAHVHISLSQIRDSPNLEGQVPVFISPKHWVPFSSPPTTRRDTVEVFDPTSCHPYKPFTRTEYKTSFKKGTLLLRECSSLRDRAFRSVVCSPISRPLHMHATVS